MVFNRFNKLFRGALALSMASCIVFSPLHAQELCGVLDPEGQFGPFDYTTAEGKANLAIVENYHFGSGVQNLRPGGAPTGADLDYTLRAFPNHHRALERMIEFSQRNKGAVRPPGATYTMDCYFNRALRINPDDGIVYMLFGNYLAKTNKFQSATEKYQEALRLRPEDANVHYNTGLAYFNLKNYDLSVQHAKKAYELGFPLPGLKNKLQKVGKWKEG